MTKKLTRSRRRELRSKGGQLRPMMRAALAQKAAEKQAEEVATSARIHEAREVIARREDAPVSEKRKKGRPGRRDLTLLLLLGVTAVAAIVYWLAQRPPTKPASAPPPSAGAPAKAPPQKARSADPPG